MKKIIFYSIGAVLLVYVLGFIAVGGDLAIYRFWAPHQANADREVFEHSQSYVEGKITHLGDLCYAFDKSVGASHAAFAAEIRNEAATTTVNRLPQDEQACIYRAKGE